MVGIKVQRTSTVRDFRFGVVGVRRVWGTMSMCTISTVQNEIKRVCGLISVRVRRKTRMSPSGKQKWWFVLHDEPTLYFLRTNGGL